MRRWQVARISAAFSTCGLENGIRLRPLLSLLQVCDNGWVPAEHRSAIVGGQWCQYNLFKAGRADSPLCALCGMAHGTLAHRLWDCMHPALVEAGSRHVPPEIVAQARAGIASGLCAQWERALLLVPDLQSTAKGPFDTFQWTVMPEGGAIEVTFYRGGSRCGGRDPLLGSFGGAFAARDAQGKTVAAAHGKPPRWVRSVPGAETWVFAEAAFASIGSPAFRTDCLGVAMVGAKGRRFATCYVQLRGKDCFRLLMILRRLISVGSQLTRLWLMSACSSLQRTAMATTQLTHWQRRQRMLAPLLGFTPQRSGTVTS